MSALSEIGRFASGKPIKPGRQGQFKAFGSNGVIGGSDEYRHARGVIIGRVGAYCGSVAISREPFWASDNTVVIEPALADDLDFLYYLLLGANLNQHAGGSAQPLVTQATLKALRFRVPPQPGRTKIGGALRVLDDLIENNRRQAALLEEIGRSIYREWFVHFRYPGHTRAPFVESPLGAIPGGWDVARVADLCSHIGAGGTPRRSESAFWEDGEVDWYKTGDLTDSVLIHSSERITRYAVEATNTRTFAPDTILMAIYGSPTVGRLGLVETVSSANQAALGLVAHPGRSTTEHLWFVLRELRAHLNQIAQGAAQQNVSKQKVAASPVVLPPLDLVHAFTTAAGPPWRLSHSLSRQADALSSIRDLLLPKLVTGQISVSSSDDLDALVAVPL